MLFLFEYSRDKAVFINETSVCEFLQISLPQSYDLNLLDQIGMCLVMCLVFGVEVQVQAFNQTGVRIESNLVQLIMIFC